MYFPGNSRGVGVSTVSGIYAAVGFTVPACVISVACGPAADSMPSVASIPAVSGVPVVPDVLPCCCWLLDVGAFLLLLTSMLLLAFLMLMES